MLMRAVTILLFCLLYLLVVMELIPEVALIIQREWHDAPLFLLIAVAALTIIHIVVTLFTVL